MKGKQGKKTNPILWFLFAVIIPVTVALSLTLLILSFSGVDVVGWTKDKMSHIPVISTFVPTNNGNNIEEKLRVSEAEVNKQATEIKALNQQIQDLEAHINQSEKEMLKLENQQKEKKETSEDLEEKYKEQQKKFKSIAASFKNMDKKQAALIFDGLSESAATSIFMELSNDVRGGILEAMDSKKAAKLAEAFIGID